uniref:Lipocalin n=1 Tax=Rhipicephalus appendiculatus TaxID=34631 RepID=A0A131YR70_RHIAP
MTELFNVAVVALLLIAARQWCDANGNETAGDTEQPPRVDPDNATINPFYLFFLCNPTFWVTQGNATPDNCSWFEAYNLTKTEVKLEMGTRWSQEEEKCCSGYITYNFGANGTFFSVSTVVGFGYFERMHYTSVNCTVIEEVGWYQKEDKKWPNCSDDLDPFTPEPCCYANDTEQLNKSEMAEWLGRVGKVPGPYYCSSRPIYMIYLSSNESVPFDCFQAYENLTRRKH